jgi:membrane protease YdiL (CAAX protease family)
VRPTVVERIVAFFEVLLCSDYPSQLAIGATLILLGIPAQTADGSPVFTFIVALSLIDTVVLVGFILLFLTVQGENPRTVLIGPGPYRPEARAGLMLIVSAFMLAAVTLGVLQFIAPQLHNVEHNPLKALMRTPMHTAIFAIVVVIAGGVREELQRAFLLHRFERNLGGGTVGIVATSIVFGAGHLQQGLDATVATGLLGAFWGIVYLRRRSAVAPIVSHAGFNLLQLVQFLIIGR